MQKSTKKKRLIDHVETYFSDWVEYAKDKFNYFREEPKDAMIELKDDIIDNIDDKWLSAKQLTKRAYRGTTTKNAKAGARETKRFLNDGVSYVKAHPITTGTLFFSAAASLYLYPRETLLVGAGMAAKTMYDLADSYSDQGVQQKKVKKSA